MRSVMGAVLGLCVGVIGAHFLLPDNGYVLINFRGYLIEMSVPGLVLVLVVAYAAVRTALTLWRWPRRMGALLAERRRAAASRKLTAGLVYLTSGDWKRGERLLTQSVRGSDAPLVSYLLAARAAQQQGHRDRRDEWLQLAYEELPAAKAAVMLTQAELQLEAGELERALATLKRLDELHPGHPMGLALQARAHEALGDRRALLELLPRLDAAVIDSAALERYALAALTPQLGSGELTDSGLAALWSSLTPELRRSPALIAERALALERLGGGSEAERELATALRQRWHPALVDAYGRVKAADGTRQLRRAERWLESRPEDGRLLLTAARLCIRNKLWGKARSYLESSLALAPTVEAYALYGRLLADLGESAHAADAYRSGLSLVAPSSGPPALAAPAAASKL
jgi:HemY protein